MEYIGQRMTADRAYIFEQNDRGTFDNTYEWCKAGVSKEKDNLQDVPYEGIIETWFAQFQESNNVIIHDIEECKKTSEAIYERLKPQGVNTLVTRPIKINGKMVGFYGVDNPPEEKLHEISNLIDMIEFMISFMIRLRDNAVALEHSALYDQLTDCKNRKALDWAYTEKLEKYFPLAIVMCNINGLKEINDQKGHDVGDKFIVQTAQTLKSVFGKEELSMSRTQRKYDHEYKVQAVKLAREIGGAKAAKELGIPEGTIHTWLKAVRAGKLDIGEGSHTPASAMSLSEEITMLRKRVKEQDKEIRRLKEENEFLEEASAFFAASRRKSVKTRE